MRPLPIIAAAAAGAAGLVLPAAAAPARVPRLTGQWSASVATPSPGGPVAVTLKVTRQNGGSVRGSFCEKPAGAPKARCVTVTGTVDAKGTIRVTAPSENERVASGSVVDAAHIQVSLSSPQEMFAEAYVTLVKG